MSDSKLSIVIPVLNDVAALKKLLPQLQTYRQFGHEVILVDGGSTDGSVSCATSLVDRILMTGTGRGRQMNLGADNVRHEIILFLHADSQLADSAVEEILQAMALPDRHWGRCNVKFDEPGLVYSLIATMMNLRSRITGVATGDQGIFVRNQSFHVVGRFEDIPLMEDISLSKALRKLSWPLCPDTHIVTSARRWKNRGVLKTIILMWGLRLAYFFGVNTHTLARHYYPPGVHSERKTEHRDG